MVGSTLPVSERPDPTPWPRLHGIQCRFLEGLTRDEINDILADADERKFTANTVIVNHEEPAAHLFLLTKGSGRHFYITEGGQKVLLRWLLPGDITGGRALLREPASYLLSTEIIKNSTVLVWPRESIQEYLRRHPKLSENALSLASEYMAWFLASHLALVSKSAQERLAQVLLCLTEGIGHKTLFGTEVDITNEELANASNVTLFTACRILSGWQRNGAISKRRGKVVVRSPERILSSVSRLVDIK
jgi:CRP-like cAMP-binding protein